MINRANINDVASAAGVSRATVSQVLRGTGRISPETRSRVLAVMKEIGYGSGYEYDHDADEAFSGQDYFPEEMRRQSFYRPTDRGAEAAIAERMARWDQVRRQRRRG